MKALTNPENGADIDHVFRNSQGISKKYIFKRGETLAFDDEVANFLLETYGFLQVPEVKVVGNKFKCSECDYTSELKVAVIAHGKGHKKEGKEATFIEVGGFADTKVSTGENVISPLHARDYERSRERGDDLPSIGRDGKDVDGVAWYGKGLEDDDPRG